MKNKGRADNEGYNTLLWAPRGCQERKDALLVAWVGGFLLLFTATFFLLLDFQLSPAAAYLLGNTLPRSHGRPYKDILLQSKRGQETIILSRPFLGRCPGLL